MDTVSDTEDADDLEDIVVLGMREKPQLTSFAGVVGVDANTANVLVAFGAANFGPNQFDLQLSKIDPDGTGSDINQYQLRYKRQLLETELLTLSGSLAYRDTEDLYSDSLVALQLSPNWQTVIVPSIEIGYVSRDFDAGSSDNALTTKLRLDAIGPAALKLAFEYEFENNVNDEDTAAVYVSKLFPILRAGETALVLSPQLGWQEKGTLLLVVTGIF